MRQRRRALLPRSCAKERRERQQRVLRDGAQHPRHALNSHQNRVPRDGSVRASPRVPKQGVHSTKTSALNTRETG